MPLSCGIVLFHRDLRLYDNLTLLQAIASKLSLIPLFIFTPTQTQKNVYFSAASFQFMLECLTDLDAAIAATGGRMVYAYGEPVDILAEIAATNNISHIFETADYTPYAKTRTASIAKLCKKIEIEYVQIHDSYLTQPGTIVNKSGKTYQKFTPFYDNVKHHKIPHPCKVLPKIAWATVNIVSKTTLMQMFTLIARNPLAAIQGGRTSGLRLLKHIPRDYATIHDIPSEAPTHLSPHNHFGTISIREAYWASNQCAYRRQLWWRDFYGHVMDDFKSLYGVSPYAFQTTWPPLTAQQRRIFEQWKTGTTGIPLIDAGIREMLTTGYMHNRVRLAVASWLVKDMGIHWRLGERFFAQHLIDYDPAQNMMNWIWVASVLPFASAPFRRIDPIKTAERFDADGKYVKQFLHSELFLLKD